MKDHQLIFSPSLGLVDLKVLIVSTFVLLFSETYG